MNYAGLVTYIVKAVQQLASQLSDLANTVASFADHFTTRELTFTRATGDEIDANTGKFHSLCVEASNLPQALDHIRNSTIDLVLVGTSRSSLAARLAIGRLRKLLGQSTELVPASQRRQAARIAVND